MSAKEAYRRAVKLSCAAHKEALKLSDTHPSHTLELIAGMTGSEPQEVKRALVATPEESLAAPLSPLAIAVKVALVQQYKQLPLLTTVKSRDKAFLLIWALEDAFKALKDMDT